MNILQRCSLLILLTLLAVNTGRAEFSMSWEASTSVNAGSGTFAPFYIASNSGGIYTSPFAAYERASLHKELVSSSRFNYGFGAELIAGASSNINYDRYNASDMKMESIGQHSPYFRIQNLWGGVKYRSLFITAGMKRNDRSFFNTSLGSGDIVISDNARPIPMVQVGFIDFQNIPFTQGWVQIRGDIAYGKLMDSHWLEDHFNYFTGFVTTGVWMHHKSCHFRTNPAMRFSVTVGMQHAAQFGGHRVSYLNGKFTGEQNDKPGFRDFIDVFVQKRGTASGVGGDDAFFTGNHLGSWDLKMRYLFSDNSMLSAYAQFPWEDGSAIGKLNGFDGVWGLEYTFADSKGYITGLNLELLTFMNHSGPLHWAPNDHPGTSVTGEATGADDYYNNYFYNGWQNYGMSIGSPFFKSPLYNTDGFMRFTDTRFWGLHLGASGNLLRDLEYRLLASYRKCYGTPYIPSPVKRENTSMMLEMNYSLPGVKGLSIKAQIAFDAGNLYGDNFGALASLVYTGNIVAR